ncbi:hypothetical protein B0I37DRAFT_41447 [Chaetomium sp. MPI-CAGE-AT-0009]|nr:hypothetical protein B0I37DRAFT_41447 [Chaetomium sp. MPI-CAGE-AT-0009]
MTDKRYRSGPYQSSVPNGYLSDPSRISASGLMSAPSAHPPTSAGRTSSIGFISLLDSSMDPGPGNRLPLPSHAPLSGNSSPQPPPPGVSASQIDSNRWTYSPTYSHHEWCYMTASPEPMDTVNHGDGDDLAESTCVFPSQSKRTTLVEEEYAKKETTKDGKKKRNHTSTPNAVQPWTAEPRGCLMSQGAMDGEDHRCYDNYFDIPGALGIQAAYPYAWTIDIEDPNKPESTDRPGEIDVVENHRVGGEDHVQEEEEDWDNCAVEGGYPEGDSFEYSQGNSTTQQVYQAGVASWISYFYRH